MNRLINWIVKSSANPEEASLTIKGILLANVAFIMLILKIIGSPISESEIYSTIGDITLLSGSILATIGLLRKIALTYGKK